MKSLKNLLIAAAAIGLVVSASSVFAETWDIDPAHSEIGFKVRHMMVSNVRGSFHEVRGALEFDEADITRSSIDVTIVTASIDTGVEKRDKHLRSPDFFDVEKYPALTFRSKNVQVISDGVFEVAGDLTIHGVTREVVLDVEGLTHQAKDPRGNTVMGATATTKINRKDYGLTWNKALETGGVLVGDEISITLEVELKKRSP